MVLGFLRESYARFGDLRERRSRASIDDILEWFEGLDRTQVEAVLEFVARSLDRAPEYIS